MFGVSEAGVQDWAVLVTACTPVLLAIVAVAQLVLKRKLDKVDDEQQKILGHAERTENMSERNTRTLHNESMPVTDEE